MCVFSLTELIPDEFNRLVDERLQRSSLIPIQPHGSRPPLFCVSLIQSDVGVQARTDSKWSGMAARWLECYRIPGRHRGILEDSRLQETAQVLQQCLEKLQMEPSASGGCS
jgi:hypothetical protein